MADADAKTETAVPDESAIVRAHAIYTPTMLAFYDVLVHGLSNRIAWRCPTKALLELYRRNLSADHLEAGVGTGFLLDRGGRAHFDRLVLLDINRHCLDRAGARLARFRPVLRRANLLASLEADIAPFASVGLTYVLHCLPGDMQDKLVAIDRLKPLLRPEAVLFGATILGRGGTPNLAARTLLDLYNAKGVFNNLNDDFDTLARGLRQRFALVEVEQCGLVALFRAAQPRGAAKAPKDGH